VIGKFPPIQGGVSMRTYWTAHSLAKRGHDVHVVTNAKEAEPPFRMHMRPRDWKRCGGRYGDGAVTVHWTDPVDGAQSYIPMASPFVSKLAGLAARAHAEHGFDVVYSHYLEPYGVAAHLVSQMARLPHVVRMAGSDAGRLWHHRQLAPLYDHVLQSAATVVAAGTVADRAVARGVDPARIAFGGGFQLMLGADLRYLAPGTRLAIIETGWGLVPDMAGTQLMRHLAREDIVRELTYTARVFSAEEALAFGFATRIVDDPLAAALSTAREIASRSPDAIRAAKRLLNLAVACDAATGLAAETAEQKELLGKPNHIEAVKANLENRTPVWSRP